MAGAQRVEVGCRVRVEAPAVVEVATAPQMPEDEGAEVGDDELAVVEFPYSTPSNPTQGRRLRSEVFKLG
jgi:hypothetical protein